jgi:hypothetical protein
MRLCGLDLVVMSDTGDVEYIMLCGRGLRVTSGEPGGETIILRLQPRAAYVPNSVAQVDCVAQCDVCGL